MTSAPQLKLEEREGVSVNEDGTIGHQAERANASLKKQEAEAKLHESSLTKNIIPGQNLLGYQDSAKPGIRPSDITEKVGEPST